jgi:hypothetical protein
MKIGAFDLTEPVPQLRAPHAIVMIRPWVDVGSVGTLTLRQMERHFHAQPLTKLSRPGTFFDFTRYRPTVKIVNGQREMTYPNTTVSYAHAEAGVDLLFVHLLEPHAMAEDYVDSVIGLLRHFKASVYCRIGAMYGSVPHTRPIIITGNPGSVEQRTGANPPLIQQRHSQYEGPTTVLNLLNDAATEMDMASMSLMAHLPHYAQLEEDFAGAARMLEVLSAFYDVPSSLMPTHRGKLQYAEIQAAVDQQPEVKALVARLESHYDSKYGRPQPETAQPAVEEDPAVLSPEIERFLEDLDLGL